MTPIPARTRLLVVGALLLATGFLLLPSSPARTGAPAPPPLGDPFVAAGVDTAGAGRVLLPGVHSVSDAAETEDGWIVLDHRGDRIHALDRAGALRWSAGGEGRGPGELLRPVALTVVDSTVVVADARGTALDRFGLDGAFVGRTVPRVTDCLGNLVRGIGPWRGTSVVLLRLCLDPGTGDMDVRADRVGPDGGSTTLATLPLKNLRRPGDDLLAAGVLGVREPLVYLGTTTSRCVRSFRIGPAGGGSRTPPAGTPDSVCLPEAPPVPVPEEQRRWVEETLGRRPLARVLGLRAPSSLPPFDRIFPSRRGLVFRTVTSVEGRALLRVGLNGGVRPLPVPATEHTFVGTRSVLVSWQETDGTALRIVTLPGFGRGAEAGPGLARSRRPR